MPDGVNVHAFLMPRAEFRKTVEGAVRNSFMHSLLAKGRLLYTHDETIAALCARLHEIGERDTQVQLLAAATHALPSIDKAHKWFVTRGDLDYTALWILYAATPLARIEVLSARLLADREVIPQAMKLNPAFFKIIYTDLLNTKKTRKSVQAALDAIDDYLARARGHAVPRRCSNICARSAKRGRPPRSKTTSSATSTRRRDHRLRISGRPGADRQGLHARPTHQEEQRRWCRNWRSFYLGEAPDEF